MQHGVVDVEIVSYECTTAAGDVCNMIGIYLKRLAAKDNDTPPYAVMRTSTIDQAVTNDLTEIPIGEHGAPAVTHMPGRLESDGMVNALMHPDGIAASNPASGVTPHRQVPGIIIETGLWQP